MNKAERLQTIFNICFALYSSNSPILLSAIYKKLDSKIPKTTISYDLKYMRPLIIPNGKQWVFTLDGIKAAQKDDIFQFINESDKLES